MTANPMRVLDVSARSTKRRMAALEKSLGGVSGPGLFDPDCLSDLPEPVRRYLLHAIAPGTPLAASVRLEIGGSIALSRDSGPLPMESEELLAPPWGFVWTARVRKGPLTIRGYDALTEGRGETRWWLGGMIPVARGEGPDVTRSARGRLLGESFLLPSSLLPSERVRWEATGDSSIQAHFAANGETLPLRIEIAGDGRLRRLAFPRWNSDPRNGPVGLLPFACDEIGDERTFAGYTIPTRFRAGWRLGETEEFPFFFARIRSAVYR